MIIPIKKNNSVKWSCENVRPISIIPVIAKVIDKILYKRVNNFISRHNIIHSNQYAYKKNVGSLNLIYDTYNYIIGALNEKKIVVAVFLDLTKAFDTIDNQIL